MVIKSRLITIAMFVPAAAFAQAPTDDDRTNVSLTGGVGYSDNIGRDEAMEIQSVFYSLGTEIDWTRTGSRFNASVGSDVQYREFDEDNFDSQIYGDFDAALNLTLVPDVLTWSFSDQFGQARRNEFEAAAPDNRQNINNFSTGPSLTLPLGGRSQLSTAATYSIRDFEEAARADSKSTDIQLGYLRSLSQTRNVGLTAVSRNIEFDNAFDSEFDINSYFLTYDSQAAQGSFGVELGFDRVDTGASKDDGVRFNLSSTRRVGAYSTFGLNAGRRITDNGALLRESGGDVFDRVDQISAVDDALTRTNFGASFGVQRPRSSYSLAFGWADDEFETLGANDVERYQADFEFMRELTPRRTLGVDARILRRDFATAGERNDEWQVGVDYMMKVGARLGVTFGYTYRRLNSTQRADFEENQFVLSFSYRITAG